MICKPIPAFACLFLLWEVTLSAAPPPVERSPMLKELLKGRLNNVEEIVFANRLSYDDPHWYANIGYYCNDRNHAAYPGNGKPGAGRLCKLNLKTGKVAVLLDARGGSIRDPTVHYSGEWILFSWRKKGTINYNLYEIKTDGTGLRQVTSSEFDDYEATYLPDDSICFVSTRCRRWVNCWKTQVGILYRCERNGENVRQISSNIEHDNTPSVLPDGRILYTRWEYVDRSQVGYHQLWTINPDGTGQMVYYGNQKHYPLYIETRPIPGTGKVVGIDSPGHGRCDHYGYVTVFSQKFGPDDPRGARKISKGNFKFCDPYPLSENRFLVAGGKNIFLMGSSGTTELIHRSERRVYEPRPIMERPREKIIKNRRKPEQKTGSLILADMYTGRKLNGIRKGEIKKLLILETLPKPVSFSGGPDLISWLGTFTLERVLGTVPVEEDGSAYFELPADRPVFFVALDENDMSVKRMQSFTSVMPGEVTSCVGCHERRTRAPANPGRRELRALRRRPSKIKPFKGYPDVLDFRRDIQPVLDRNCTACHNFNRYAGSLSLEGDLGPVWSHSFYALFARKQVGDGRNGYGNQPPRTIGSSASPLLEKLKGSHCKASASKREWRTVWLWIESAAPYAGSYAALRNEAEMALGRAAGSVFRKHGKLLNRRCRRCHGRGNLPNIPFNPPPYPDKRGIKRPLARYERRVTDNDPLARFSVHILLNLSRPSLSPLLLAPLAEKAGGWEKCGRIFENRNDPGYKQLLGTLKQSKQAMSRIPRYGTPDFNPNPQYIREMKRYGILPADFEAGDDGIDYFELDQKYWQSFWYRGP